MNCKDSDENQSLPGRLRRRVLLSQLAAAAMLSITGEQSKAAGPLLPRWSWTHSGCQACLPKHDYQHRAHSPSVIVGSLPIQDIDSMTAESRIAAAANPSASPVPLVDQIIRATEPSRYKRKRVRPSRVQLAIDHCRVSDIVVDFDNSGYWWASFMAEQNLPLEPEEQRRYRTTLPLKRNAFEFKVRLLSTGNAASREQSVTDVLDREPNPGRLIVAKIEPQEFWVQKKRPRHLQYTGYCEQIDHSFAMITAAEFEFSFRLDPLSDRGQNVQRMNGP